MVYANSAMTNEADQFHCVTCSRDFKRDEDLYKHLCNSGHPYCFYCGPEVQMTSSLSEHFKANHSNFQCPECPREFFLRNSWRNHMNSHWRYQDPGYLFMHDVMLEGESLHDFADRLSPSKEFYERCSEIVSRIEKFMKHNTSFKNGSILMAGSVGKRTALGDDTDIDMMYYMNNTSLDDMINILPTIITRLRQHVLNGDFNWASGLKFERVTPYSVQFKLSIGNQPHIPVDLLPVVDILKPNSKVNREKLYTDMKTMNNKNRDYCKRCLSRVQVDFVRKVPRNIKGVIRVIKSWVKNIKKDERCGTVLSYFCELVVIRTWMNQGEPSNQDIDLLMFVKLVLYELCFCEIIRITWPERYQNFHFIGEIDGPMVLDPANPFCNVAPKIQHAAVISRKARQLLSKPAYSAVYTLGDLADISLFSGDNDPSVPDTVLPMPDPYFYPASYRTQKPEYTVVSMPDPHFYQASSKTPTPVSPRVMYTSGSRHTEPRVTLETGKAQNMKKCPCGKKCCIALAIVMLLMIGLACFLGWYFWPRPEGSKVSSS